MKEPKFKVGEEVVLQSRQTPHLNGDAIVIAGPLLANEANSCPHCGKNYKGCIGEGFGYYLSTQIDNDCCVQFCESALRKKHRPSDKSFNELIKEINSMVKS